MPDLETPWQNAFPQEATREDIYFLFRLLLGRNPNPEEWPGHSSRAGRPLRELVRHFVNSREFSRRKLLEREAGEIGSVRVGDFVIYADTRDPGVGARILEDAAYEADVTWAFNEILRPGQTVVDVGANIGFYTMLSASRIGPDGRVLAIEPNPANVRLLEASRRANGFEHVTVLQAAASDQLGLLALHAAHSNGMTGELQGELADIAASVTVPCVEVDRVAPADRTVSLIKMDVEGAEGLALRGALKTIDRDRPRVIAEFDPINLQGVSRMSGRDFLGLMTSRGYGVRIIEKGGFRDCGSDHDMVLREYEAARVHHIDLLFAPAA
jgi:FkbM family methyltransferase